MAQLESPTCHALAMEMSIIETSEIFASGGACDTASPLQQPTHPPRGRSPQPSMASEKGLRSRKVPIVTHDPGAYRARLRQFRT